jgi:predicted  nucleic acid-binding Zn-ribbon protein
LETWEHIRRAFENLEQRVAERDELFRKEWQTFQKAIMDVWEHIRRALEKRDQRTLDYERAFARLEKEIEELKKDKSAKDVMIEELKKDRSAQDDIIRDLQQRLTKLETTQNLTA